LATIRIIVEVLEAGAARQGGQRELEIADSIDCDGMIEQAITAAADEIEFFKLRKG
jgi:hypothetical protein